MGQQGHLRPYRDRAKRRLGCDDAAEKDRDPGFEEGPARSNIIAASIPT
jgi:hypothetical protein